MNDKEEPHAIGWFSAGSKKQTGSVMWRTPDGDLVEITEALSPGKVYGWSDAECRGPVVAYV